jgi:hypothetical protein
VAVCGSVCGSVRQCVSVSGSVCGSVCGSALGNISVWQCGRAAVRQCAAECVSACGCVQQCAQQCAAVCGSVWQCACWSVRSARGSVLGSVWQCVCGSAAVCGSAHDNVRGSVRQCTAVCVNVWQCMAVSAAVCGSAHRVCAHYCAHSVHDSVWQCVAMCGSAHGSTCSVLQCGSVQQTCERQCVAVSPGNCPANQMRVNPIKRIGALSASRQLDFFSRFFCVVCLAMPHITPYATWQALIGQWSF